MRIAKASSRAEIVAAAMTAEIVVDPAMTAVEIVAETASRRVNRPLRRPRPRTLNQFSQEDQLCL